LCRASFDHFACREDHFQARCVSKVIPIRSVAKPSLNGVADQTGIRARAAGIHPELRIVLFQESIELTLGDPGLNRHVGEFLTEVEDSVHPAEVEDRAAATHWDTRTIAPILAPAHDIKRNGKPVRDAKTFLNLFATAGPQDGGHRLRSTERRSLKLSEEVAFVNDVTWTKQCLPLCQSLPQLLCYYHAWIVLVVKRRHPEQIETAPLGYQDALVFGFGGDGNGLGQFCLELRN